MSVTRYRTLVEAFVAAPPECRFVTMFRDEDDVETVTFGEFLAQAAAQAKRFEAAGLGSGDTAILIMQQGIGLMSAFMGAMLLGAVPTILAYPTFKIDPAKYRSGLAGVSENLKPSLVVLDEMFPPDLLRHVSAGGDAKFIRNAKVAVPCTGRPIVPAVCEPDQVAFIQHSAGTTGLQKGVALSNTAVLRQLEHLASSLQIEARDCIYTWLPLYHDMGLIACFMLPMVYHLPVVMQSPTDWVMKPGTMLQLISEYRCTLSWVPNFAFQFLARRVRGPDWSVYDLSSLRALINCSEPVRAQSLDEFLGRYAACGIEAGALQSSYAMAENVFAVTQSSVGDRRGPRRVWVSRERLYADQKAVAVSRGADEGVCLVSSGHCLDGNEVRVVSPAEMDLPDGWIGEILIRSDSLFDGYYNRADLTAKVLRAGWYHSGDLGFLLDGELYITGRKNDLLIVAGKNIYPEDVEAIVCSHPAVHDGRAVALGLYNPDLGTEEIVVVAEVEKEEHLERALDIETVLRSAIAAELDVGVRAVCLKPPRWLVKSTAGKPARAATRERLLLENPDLSLTA